jgi:hypothetical protein
VTAQGLDQSWSFQHCSRTPGTRPGLGSGNLRWRGCPGLGERDRAVGVPLAHLDDERVLKHGVPDDPQPLVLHSRADVGHRQGPPRGRADLADRAARWLLLLLPSDGVLTGTLGLRHPGGRGESALPQDGESWPRRRTAPPPRQSVPSRTTGTGGDTDAGPPPELSARTSQHLFAVRSLRKMHKSC